MARGSGNFRGTLGEQICHQGYIPSPTVSLTASANVAAHYATLGGKRDQALVFTIDPKAAGGAGPIWDSFVSMTHSTTPAWIESDFDIVVKLVTRLGNLHRAGSVIEGLSNGLCNFASEYHATLSRTQEYSKFVSPEVWKEALTVVSGEELDQVCSVLENFLSWHAIPEGVVSASRYVSSFLMVQQELVKAIDHADDEWRNIGWDATALGYFAKTCRDQEFFSSGSIPGNCISEAWIVDRDGNKVKALKQ